MKREDLFEAIGDVDDMLLGENVAPAGRRRWMPFAVSVAACIAVIAVTARMLPPKLDVGEQQTGELAEVSVTEANYYTPPETTETELPSGPGAASDTAEAQPASITDETYELSATSGTDAESEVLDSHSIQTEDTPEETDGSFRYVLSQIYENQSYGNITSEGLPESDSSADAFAICDVDGDNTEELVVRWAGLGMIFGYDAQGDIVIRFQGSPEFSLYSNGLLLQEDTQEQEGRSVLYTLYRYTDGSYIADVTVWKSNAEEVYYIGEQGPLDEAEYQIWTEETFAGAELLKPSFRRITEAEIAAVMQ